jgi:Domain of unknown function (DUF4845)
MNHKTLKSQQGFGFIGFAFWGFIACAIIIVGLRVMPVVTEYYAIKKAVFAVKDAGDASAIRSAFDQQTKVNYVDNFSGRELIIEKTSGGTSVGFAYQRVVALAGPVSLLFEFSNSELVR